MYVCVYACMRVVYICADGDGFEIGDWRGGSLHMYIVWEWLPNQASRNALAMWMGWIRFLFVREEGWRPI